MANATVLPPLKFFQWATPTAPKPRLSAPTSAGATTYTFTSPPLDKDGNVITSAFIFGIRRSDFYVESVLVPAGGMSVDGLTATGCTSGINLEGLDYTTANTDLQVSHLQGEPVFCNVTGVYETILKAWANGTLASGGSGLIIGTDADGTVTLSRSTGVGTSVGFIRWNTSNDMAQFSNDGSAWTNFSDVSASDLVKVSSGDTTPGYLSSKIVSATGGVDFSILNPGTNETLQLSLDLSEGGYTAGPLATVISDVTSTATELNKLSGTSANVTSANLNTLTAGSASNADLLHTHSNLGGQQFYMGENGTAGKALALQRVRIPYFTGFTEADANFGDVNTTARRGWKFTPRVSVNIDDLTVRLKKSGTPVDNVTIEIQADSGGSPSGVSLGTSDAVTGGSVSASYADKAFSWSSPVSLVAGTTYWFVIKRSGAIDGSNYYVLGCLRNTSIEVVGNFYINSERKNFDLNTSTWGSSSSTAIPFFTTNDDLGAELVLATNSLFGKTWSFIGFLNANANKDALGTVNTFIDSNQSGLSIGQDYYMGSSAGSITAVPPSSFDSASYSYKIGSALSPTQVKIALGEKMMWGTQEFSSTTTAFMWCGFIPRTVEIYAVSNGSAPGPVSNGLGDGTANRSSYVGNNGSGVVGIDTSNAWHIEQAAGPTTHTGVVDTFSSLGARLNNTKTGGGDNAELTWIARG